MRCPRTAMSAKIKGIIHGNFILFQGKVAVLVQIFVKHPVFFPNIKKMSVASLAFLCTFKWKQFLCFIFIFFMAFVASISFWRFLYDFCVVAVYQEIDGKRRKDGRILYFKIWSHTKALSLQFRYIYI